MPTITSSQITPAQHADYEALLFPRAVKAYRRSLLGTRLTFQQPAQGSSRLDADGSVYELRNARGELARFRYDASADRLRKLNDPS